MRTDALLPTPMRAESEMKESGSTRSMKRRCLCMVKSSALPKDLAALPVWIKVRG